MNFPPRRWVVSLLFAATMVSRCVAADAYAIFKSVDGGQSWVRSDAGLSGQARINALGTAGGVLFAGTDAGMFFSGDEGRRWQRVEGEALATVRVLSFASKGGRVFAGTDGRGLLVSSDAGKSWAFDEGFRPRKVRCVLAVRGKVYAGTDDDGVFASTDEGKTWVGLVAGFPSGAAQVFALTNADGVLFAGLYGRGLYVWDERRHSWSKIEGVAPLALVSVGRTLVAGHNPGGLHWSADSGVTWSRGIPRSDEVSLLELTLADPSGELSAEAPVWEMATDGSRVFAGAAAGIYYSEDKGRTWMRARRGLPVDSPGIAFLATQGFVFAAARIPLAKGEFDGARSGTQADRSVSNPGPLKGSRGVTEREP